MSGIKGRSGRKREVVVEQCRAAIDMAVMPADWRAIWKALAAAAKKGNVQAARMLVEYRYGTPQNEPPQNVAVGTVAYYLPERAALPMPGELEPSKERDD